MIAFRGRGRPRRAALWLPPIAFACGLAACAGPEPQPGPGPTSHVAADGSGSVAALDSTAGPTGPEMFGFPPVGGVSSRDFSYEETTGPLQGQVTKFYRIRHVLGATLKGLVEQVYPPQTAPLRIVDV